MTKLQEALTILTNTLRGTPLDKEAINRDANGMSDMDFHWVSKTRYDSWVEALEEVEYLLLNCEETK
jgi:hypothetical protein